MAVWDASCNRLFPETLMWDRLISSGMDELGSFWRKLSNHGFKSRQDDPTKADRTERLNRQRQWKNQDYVDAN